MLCCSSRSKPQTSEMDTSQAIENYLKAQTLKIQQQNSSVSTQVDDSVFPIYDESKWMSIIRTQSVHKTARSEISFNIRRGNIPSNLRSFIWVWMIDLYETYKSRHSTKLFSKLLSLKCNDAEQIATDVHRTYKCELDDQHCEQLTNVLIAYANYDNEIGYVQGMNFVVGALIKQIQHEETAFWVFVHIMFHQNYRDVFIKGFKRYRVLLENLKKRIKYEMPTLEARLQKLEVAVDTCFDHQIFTMILYQAPFELAVRIIDLFILEGDCKQKNNLRKNICLEIINTILLKLMQVQIDQILMLKDSDEMIIYLRNKLISGAIEKFKNEKDILSSLLQYTYFDTPLVKNSRLC